MRTRLALAAATGLALVATACQPAGPFTSTADMHTPRAGHTATLLPSGRVIVAGGAAVGQPSVERYDPASGRWLVRAEMLTPRHGHRATRLGSGKVLVTGGRSTATGALLTAAEIYDPADDRWSRAAGTPHPGGHSAALLPNGKVLAVFADERGRGWLYDPVTDAWSPTGPKVTTAWRTTTGLPDGGVLVVGGDTVQPTETTYGASRAEFFHLDTGTWRPAGTAPGLLVRKATALSYGAVLVLGPVLYPTDRHDFFETTTRVVRYEHVGGTWRSWEDANGCDNLHTEGMTLTALEDSSALMAGRGECAGGTYTSAVRLRSGEEPQQLAGFAERQGHAAVRLQDGRVLVTGGAFGSHPIGPDCCPPFEVRATAELYSP